MLLFNICWKVSTYESMCEKWWKSFPLKTGQKNEEGFCCLMYDFYSLKSSKKGGTGVVELSKSYRNY